jgi:Spy/CpxP family protein refolding chaperone
MKRATLSLVALLLTSQAALAQRPGGPPGGGMFLERIAQELSLDETQKTEVKRVLEEQRAKHQAERQKLASTGERPSPEQMRTVFEQHDKDLRDALRGVLTADQLVRLQQLQDERRNRMRNGPPPAAPAN